MSDETMPASEKVEEAAKIVFRGARSDPDVPVNSPDNGRIGRAVRIVGIRLRDDSNIYEFEAGEQPLKRGDIVVVETGEGPAMGEVCTEVHRAYSGAPCRGLGRVDHLAEAREKARYSEIKAKEKDIFQYCYDKVGEKGLEMSLICAEQRLDGSKTTIYFTADGRVDFRELVKDLVSRFRTRIEMRQIGVRHQAKMVGGLGLCGRPLCCSSFLKGFDPVTIKMAKEQNLSLNPAKISGMCCRLMCCLSFENAYYHDVRKDFPKVGKKVMTKRGEGKVVRQNVLKKTITILNESGEELEITQDELC